jgi:sugar (pentulose or hexulose) kinase
MTHNAVTEPLADAPQSASALIAEGSAHLGIELGSTRIKAALIDDTGTVLASGSHAWENENIEDNWTYSLDAVWTGIQDCFADLARDVQDTHGVRLTSLRSVGISAMMHGYLAFDAADELLVPFRTWRNTYTEDAAGLLSKTFGLNIPLRWSVSHLLHAVLGGEEHVGRIAYVSTLAGYVHWRLTGRKVLGVGDASGMFPIAGDGTDYDPDLLERFAGLDAVKDVPWSLAEILPQVLQAGDDAGRLTEEGAHLLDPTGALRAGAPAAAPEGDAGTGMVATHAVEPRTGNTSAGTSAFAMVVLEHPLSGPRPEIDMVTTPSGDPVAMIHTNNCTGDLDAWIGLFAEFATLIGAEQDTESLYKTLFTAGTSGRADAGGVLCYNYLSGEHQTGVASGRPLVVREQKAEFTLANFLRSQLYGAFGALAVGMEALLTDEKVALDVMYAHGGIFRTAGVAQQVLADALDTPVAVGESAGEGGAWGMALLAAYTARRADAASADGTHPADDEGSAPSLSAFLRSDIFAGATVTTLDPDPEGVAGHSTWLRSYREGLQVERLAGEVLD